jgi:hypothetical protein
MSQKKTEKARELRREIRELDVKAKEKKSYCINNIDASDYYEVSSEYRAISVKIMSKESQLKQLNSSVEVVERTVRIAAGVKCNMLL